MENFTKTICTRQISPINERTVILFAGLGMFLSTLDTGIINIALPTLLQQFHADITTISWVVTLYTLVLSGSIVAFGRLSDRYGRVRFYQVGLWIFTLASLLCGAAYSTHSLILFRGIQGIGAALLQATAAALITTLIAPERRGAALGTLGLMIGLGPILGPTIGGLIISWIGWRWIFWINIPLCALGLIGSRHLPNIPNVKHIKLNILGVLLFSIAILSLMWSVSLMSQVSLQDVRLLSLLVITLLSFSIFLVCEKRSQQPIVDLRLFKKPAFALPMLATVAFGVASAVIFIVPPFFLEKILNYAPWQVGLIAFSAPLGVVLFSRLSGKLIKPVGTTILMTVGLFCMLLALIGLTMISVNWNSILIASLLFLYGIGGGLFQAPSILAIMGAVDEAQQGTIGAVNRMVQNAAIALGVAVASAFMGFHAKISSERLIIGFQHAWTFALVFIAIAFVGFLYFFKNLKNNSIK